VPQDVPNALNGLLNSLPSRITVQGLPFDAVFTYALYTLNYVMLKVRPCQPARQPASFPGMWGAQGVGHRVT
jgi:hypothetical protein